MNKRASRRTLLTAVVAAVFLVVAGGMAYWYLNRPAGAAYVTIGQGLKTSPIFGGLKDLSVTFGVAGSSNDHTHIGDPTDAKTEVVLPTCLEAFGVSSTGEWAGSCGYQENPGIPVYNAAGKAVDIAIGKSGLFDLAFTDDGKGFVTTGSVTGKCVQLYMHAIPSRDNRNYPAQVDNWMGTTGGAKDYALSQDRDLGPANIPRNRHIEYAAGRKGTLYLSDVTTWTAGSNGQPTAVERCSHPGLGPVIDPVSDEEESDWKKYPHYETVQGHHQVWVMPMDVAKPTMTFINREIRKYPLESPGHLSATWDNSAVWVIQYEVAKGTAQQQWSHGVLPAGAKEPRLVKLSVQGATAGKIVATITNPLQGKVWNPSDVEVMRDGRVAVADNVTRQVWVFDPEGGTAPKRFGKEGGMFAVRGADAGKLAPITFGGISGIGVDENGNLYINHNDLLAGGSKQTAIESYAPDPTTGTWKTSPRWKLDAGIWESPVVFDPRDETVAYSETGVGKMDWSKPGGGWQASAWQYNFYGPMARDLRKLPVTGESRLDHIFYVGDKRFFAYSGRGGAYVFKHSEGSYTVPSARVFIYSPEGSFWNDKNPKSPANLLDPKGKACAGSFWRDVNGDGDFSPEEYLCISQYTKGGVSWYSPQSIFFDATGNLWIPMWPNWGDWTKPQVLRMIPILSTLDAGGNPQWDWEHPKDLVPPIPGDRYSHTAERRDLLFNIEVAHYEPATDVMYLLKRDPSTAGTPEDYDPDNCYNAPKPPKLEDCSRWYTLYKVSGATSGSPKLDWSLPKFTSYTFASRGNSTVQGGYALPITFTAAGDYVFGLTGLGGHWAVVDGRTGKYAGKIINPHGHTGFLDHPGGLAAYKRSNGEYVLTNVSNYYGQNQLIRWTPEGGQSFELSISAPLPAGATLGTSFSVKVAGKESVLRSVSGSNGTRFDASSLVGALPSSGAEAVLSVPGYYPVTFTVKLDGKPIASIPTLEMGDYNANGKADLADIAVAIRWFNGDTNELSSALFSGSAGRPKLGDITAVIRRYNERNK